MPAIPFSDVVSGDNADGVLIVTFDNPPVNAASQALRAGLLAAVNRLKDDPDLVAMVVTGAGSAFIAGADIREFGMPALEPILPDVIDAMERSRKPIIAAINGVALGGGAEIALGCHGRIAGRQARIGFPEVKLGLVPGAGGTQRLPRLVPIETAVDMITSGKPVNAETALNDGLVDALSVDHPLDAAIRLARSMSEPVRTSSRPVRGGDRAKADDIAHRAIRKGRGVPAIGEAARLVLGAADRAFADAVADERATFLRLRDSAEAKALRHVFFAEREAQKIPDLDGIDPRPVKTIAVIGLGLMGSGIALSALEAGYQVIGIDRTADAAAAGRARIDGLIDKNVGAGRTSPERAESLKAKLATGSDFAAAAPADLVIEAVFDDHDVKAALFTELDAILRPDAVLATNTSYLDPDRLAAGSRHPERVIGLHFFSPAHIMRLCEVVACTAAAKDAIATGLMVARKMGKLAILSGVTEGFIGNSVFSAYRREAEAIVEDGATPEAVDTALEAFGLAMGPFAVSDMAGLEIAWARRKRQAATRDPNERYVAIADRLCEAGRLGQKTGAGWYRYRDGKREPDPAVDAIIAAERAKKNITPRPFSDHEIVGRILTAMAEEGRRLVANGIALRDSDVDLVLINGYGFPAHKGGPIFADAHRG